MDNADRYNEALSLALRKLQTKDRYESEVRSFLADFDLNTVERVITYLKDRRIINDSKTTLNLIERNTGKRTVGIEKLRAELLQRGAPEETIDASIRASTIDERSQMLDALRVKFPNEVSRAKAARFLFSRGFPEEDIESVLERFFGE